MASAIDILHGGRTASLRQRHTETRVEEVEGNGERIAPESLIERRAFEAPSRRLTGNELASTSPLLAVAPPRTTPTTIAWEGNYLPALKRKEFHVAEQRTLLAECEKIARETGIPERPLRLWLAYERLRLDHPDHPIGKDAQNIALPEVKAVYASTLRWLSTKLRSDVQRPIAGSEALADRIDACAKKTTLSGEEVKKVFFEAVRLFSLREGGSASESINIIIPEDVLPFWAHADETDENFFVLTRALTNLRVFGAAFSTERVDNLPRAPIAFLEHDAAHSNLYSTNDEPIFAVSQVDRLILIRDYLREAQAVLRLSGETTAQKTFVFFLHVRDELPPRFLTRRDLPSPAFEHARRFDKAVKLATRNLAPAISLSAAEASDSAIIPRRETDELVQSSNEALFAAMEGPDLELSRAAARMWQGRLALDPGTPAEVFELLARGRVELRRLVARIDHAPERVIEMLGTDTDRLVQETALRNPNFPQATLVEMAERFRQTKTQHDASNRSLLDIVEQALARRAA